MSNTTEKTKINFGTLWQKYGTIGILVLLLVVLAVCKPSALFTKTSIPQILKQSSVNILLALGEFFAILLGFIDLSVSAACGLTGMVAAMAMVNLGLPWVVACIIGVLTGTLIGAINGALINFTGLHPFIITLGMQTIYFGVMLVVSGAQNVYGFPASFSQFMSGQIGFLPFSAIIALTTALILWFMTTRTKLGRNLYALGGNRESAWYSGINIKLHQMIVYMISGTCAGLAGVVLIGRLNAAAPTAGTGYETYAIAATIIGGTSFFGGVGKIPGVVVGGLIIGIINYGMTVLMIDASMQKIVMGALIIISVTIDHFVSKASKK
ncbi:MAG: D-allose ABC transporter permease [Lachnospiraceae bacterium]|nr:D-allose ABC transporter permease [Lachnospiraceae bacterium]